MPSTAAPDGAMQRAGELRLTRQQSSTMSGSLSIGFPPDHKPPRCERCSSSGSRLESDGEAAEDGAGVAGRVVDVRDARGGLATQAWGEEELGLAPFDVGEGLDADEGFGRLGAVEGCPV